MNNLDELIRHRNDKNALEKLLYPPQRVTIADKKLTSLSSTNTQSTTSYENGMLISISNHKTYWEDLVKQYKRQYQTIILSLTGKKISRDDICKTVGIPKRKTISDIVYNKIPIVVAGIHDYHISSEYGKGSYRNYQYQHTHFYVYNTHHYLPTDKKELGVRIRKLEKQLLRYTNSKNGRRDVVRISPVGVGTYCYTDNVKPTDLYDYLMTPKTSPEKSNLINYISFNRHQPELQYPINSIYYRKHPL